MGRKHWEAIFSWKDMERVNALKLYDLPLNIYDIDGKTLAEFVKVFLTRDLIQMSLPYGQVFNSIDNLHLQICLQYGALFIKLLTKIR